MTLLTSTRPHTDWKEWCRRTLGSLFLLLIGPIGVFTLLYTNLDFDGSFMKLWEAFQSYGVAATITNAWSPHFFGTPDAWLIIAVFAAFELLLMKILPGETFLGPITPAGNIPVYKANGVAAFATTVATFYLCAYVLDVFSPTIIYDNFGGILGALNIFSLFFCVFLYFKGKIAPSSSDASATGNIIFDYFWGTELYPRVMGWDVKMFTNCRFGMMSWVLIILSFAAKQQQLYGISDSMLVSVALQLIYIAKFFVWETGYMRSLDIMHDRAGYYICWGCLVWIPGIYTSPTLYLVNHPNHLGTGLACLIFAIGALSIMINYWADRQRQRIRATQGKCLVWRKSPALTLAHYVTEKGEHKENVLLSSGWWGFSRHFHYIPEVVGAFCWSVPALFGNFLPYFYVVFLTILLFDRAYRNDKRCAEKYGKDWNIYCKKVPYKFIPYVY